MEKIQELLAKLENNVPTKIQNKIKGLEKVKEKLELAKNEHANSPTDDSKDKLDNISEYVEEVTDEIIEDLEIAIEKAKKPVVVEEPVIAPEQTQEIQQTVTQPEAEKETSGIGWFGLIGGILLLAVTAGVVNTLKK